MHLLALDIATTTGWARWRPGMEQPAFGSRKATGDIGEWAISFLRWITGEIETHAITGVAIERPVPVTGVTNQNVTFRAVGGFILASAACQNKNVPVELVNVSQWRSIFLGVTSAPKKDDAGQLRSAGQRRQWLKKACIAECERRGWDVGKDDDAADALGLLHYYRELRKMPHMQEAA